MFLGCVCLLQEDVVTDLQRPSGLALLPAMPGASGPTILWSDLEEKKIYGINVAEENSTREVWVEGTVGEFDCFFFGRGDYFLTKKWKKRRNLSFLGCFFKIGIVVCCFFFEFVL